MSSIEIAVSCYSFQRRLCWMMSSVLQQSGKVPDIVFSVAHVKGNGNPTTTELCEFFRKEGLNIRETVYDKPDRIMRRGLSRNDMLQKATCDWILFADADIAYSPHFFMNLAEQLDGPLVGETKCMTTKRVSLNIDHCNQVFEDLQTYHYPMVVPGAGELESWPVRAMSRANGAGFFQLANVKSLRDGFKGSYIDPEKWRHDRPWGFNSDKMFRYRVGGIRKIKCLPQYHLNHNCRDNRDKQAEIQR